jgi:hypothetical protein
MQGSTQKRARLLAYQSLQCFFVKKIPALKKESAQRGEGSMNLPGSPKYIRNRKTAAGATAPADQFFPKIRSIRAIYPR